MNCPECGSKTKVVDTRTPNGIKRSKPVERLFKEHSNTTARVRECLNEECLERFYTAEVVQEVPDPLRRVRSADCAQAQRRYNWQGKTPQPFCPLPGVYSCKHKQKKCRNHRCLKCFPKPRPRGGYVGVQL